MRRINIVKNNHQRDQGMALDFEMAGKQLYNSSVHYFNGYMCSTPIFNESLKSILCEHVFRHKDMKK